MLVTTSWIEKNYNKFNNLYFCGTLPRIEFKTSRSKHTWGFASYKYDFANSTIIPLSITLSNYYDSPEEIKIQTLLHEMIHIEDYMWHPEHFIKNSKKITGHYYDAHGYWFQQEAKRITKESGYQIAKHVTKEEIGRSCLSERSQNIMNNKTKDARIIAVFDGINVWYFKTDVYKIENVKKLIKHHLPTYKKCWELTFDYEPLAARRSCNTKLSGWRMNRANFMTRMMQYKATTIKSYSL